jgi:cell division topological specificity factor
MGIFDFLTQRNKNTASVAKDRLRILIEQERGMRGAPDYLPLLQRELLDISVTLPEKQAVAATA